MVDLLNSQTLHKQSPRLIEATRQAIRRLHYSRRTEEAYMAGFASLSIGATSVIRRRLVRLR